MLKTSRKASFFIVKKARVTEEWAENTKDGWQAMNKEGWFEKVSLLFLLKSIQEHKKIIKKSEKWLKVLTALVVRCII